MLGQEHTTTYFFEVCCLFPEGNVSVFSLDLMKARTRPTWNKLADWATLQASGNLRSRLGLQLPIPSRNRSSSTSPKLLYTALSIRGFSIRGHVQAEDRLCMGIGPAMPGLRFLFFGWWVQRWYPEVLKAALLHLRPCFGPNGFLVNLMNETSKRGPRSEVEASMDTAGPSQVLIRF